MRITLVQGAFLPVPPLRGGALEKIWSQLGVEFARRGHEVTHVSRLCDRLAASEVADGVRHLRVPGFDQPGNGVLIKILDLAYSLRACRRVPRSDAIVTNTFWAPLILGAKRGPVWVDVQRMPKGQMRLYGKAARFHACSSAVRDAIIREYPAAEPRIRVIPNPLPFLPGRDVNWDGKAPVILYAGRIHPEKGIELLLSAFSRARTAGRLAGWRLELVGPSDKARGGGGAKWAEALKSRYSREDILWRGPEFGVAGLNEIYERASVFAYPSLAERGETFGLAVLEAMAWGAVPVVSDLAVFRDFVDAGKNGLVFDHRGADRIDRLAGALCEAASNPRIMAERAIEVRRSHEPGRIAELFLEEFGK